MRNSIVVPVTVALALAACGAGESARPTVERLDSAGVAIVRNLGGDVPLAWRFERRLSLGGADAGPESFYRVGPTSIGVDSLGNLYVLNWSSHRIVVFDSAGNHLGSFGREGSGPGEFESPVGMIVRPDGEVAVYDFTKGAFVRYAADGTPLGERRIPEPFFRGEMGVMSAGPVLSLRNMEIERLMLYGTGEPTQLAAVQVPALTMDFATFPNCPIRIRFRPLYAPDLIWTARGERVLISGGYGYVLDVHRADGRRLASFRRDINPIPATEERAARDQAERYQSDVWKVSAGATECRVPWEDYVEARGLEAQMPVVHSLAIAPDGTIWVRRRLAEAGTRIDLLAPKGEYLGTLPASTPFPAAFMPDGDIIVVERDELDVERLVVYELIRSTA